MIVEIHKTQTNLDDDMHVKLFCIESNAFIKSCALAIIEVHCDINLQDKFESYVLSKVTKDNVHNQMMKDSTNKVSLAGINRFKTLRNS